MVLIPRKIWENYQNKSLDKKSAVELLISIIDNSDNDLSRIESLKILYDLSPVNVKIFKYFENLFISDSNGNIRSIAAEFIKNKFIERAFPSMKWAIQYESYYDCTIKIIETLVKINTADSKSVLINEINKIKKRKYIDQQKQYNNKNFKKSLKRVFKAKKITDFTHKELAEILINYKTIEVLIKKFYTLYYKIENGLVIGLDLSDLGWNVNIWKQKFAKKIEELSEIIGLKNLRHLRILDLSNNRIKTIKELKNFENLTHLYISNNKIEIDNLKYFKNMPNLKFLDIHKNKIADNIKISELNKKLKLKVKSNTLFE